MSRPVLFGLLGLCSLLVACASADRPEPLASPDLGPAPVESLDWLLHLDGSTARLAYGVPHSDDLRIGLECRQGAGELIVTVLAPKEAGPEFLLESGGDTARFVGAQEPDPVHGGTILTADAGAQEPLFLRFRRLGWLAVWRGEAREVHAAHAGSTERIERFFSFCG